MSDTNTNAGPPPPLNPVPTKDCETKPEDEGHGDANVHDLPVRKNDQAHVNADLQNDSTYVNLVKAQFAMIEYLLQKDQAGPSTDDQSHSAYKDLVEAQVAMVEEFYNNRARCEQRMKEIQETAARLENLAARLEEAKRAMEEMQDSLGTDINRLQENHDELMSAIRSLARDEGYGSDLGTDEGENTDEDTNEDDEE